MPQTPGVYLIDTSIYIFRGWFVLPDSMVDGDGNPINAVIGFADFLLDLIEQKKPTHIACAFDTSLGSSARNQIYPHYKANRPPAPEELKYQFALCRRLVDVIGLAGFASEQYEADDILATFAKYAQMEDEPFIVITDDKDLTQLLGKHDYWWSFAKNYRLDYRGVEKRFGVRPHQIADLLALSGDKVDNIPGVPGIGMTTAARLLTKWGNIDNLYANIDKAGEMKFRGAKRIASLLVEHRDAVEIARQLTPTLIDPELPQNIDCLRPAESNEDARVQLFRQLGFNQQRCDRWEQALLKLQSA